MYIEVNPHQKNFVFFEKTDRQTDRLRTSFTLKGKKVKESESSVIKNRVRKLPKLCSSFHLSDTCPNITIVLNLTLAKVVYHPNTIFFPKFHSQVKECAKVCNILCHFNPQS